MDWLGVYLFCWAVVSVFVCSAPCFAFGGFVFPFVGLIDGFGWLELLVLVLLLLVVCLMCLFVFSLSGFGSLPAWFGFGLLLVGVFCWLWLFGGVWFIRLLLCLAVFVLFSFVLLI